MSNVNRNLSTSKIDHITFKSNTTTTKAISYIIGQSLNLSKFDNPTKVLWSQRLQSILSFVYIAPHLVCMRHLRARVRARGKSWGNGVERVSDCHQWHSEAVAILGRNVHIFTLPLALTHIPFCITWFCFDFVKCFDYSAPWKVGIL